MKEKRKKLKKYITIFMLILFILIAFIDVKASAKSTEIDTNELGKFTDEFFLENLDKYHVPGAAIAFVKDGEISFMKGYGYSDVESKKSVDPEKTVFGIASVSKLLTATAVMQQYEEGKIDLERDINEYLNDFKIEDSYEEPITMKSLLTHTSGFNQTSIGIGTRNPLEIKKLEDYLKESIPKRAYKPNQFFSYSNQGMSLAGHIVENVSNESFETYMEEKIFKPLNMKNSTFKQPIPEDMEANKAAGYSYWIQNGSLFRTNPIYYQAIPAGACYTTVNDMANFIIANLSEGQYKGVQLLKSDIMEEMHKQQFTHNDKMPGQAYGFWESFDNNKRGLFHTGTSDGYASLLYMIPEENLGFILCYNLGTDKLRSEFLRSFMNKFFPIDSSKQISPMEDYKERVRQYEGLYWNVEKPQYTLDKLEVLMSDGLVRAKELKDGSLKITDYYGENIGEYIEIEPEVFKRIDGEEIITFSENYNGKNNSYLYIKNNAFQKLEWYENSTLYIIFALFSLIIILISPFVWIKIFIKKKNCKEERNNIDKYSGCIGIFTSILVIIFCTSASIITSMLGKYAFMFGVPISLRIILIIPILLCGITILLFVISILAWKNRYWTKFKRVFFTIYTLGVILFLISLKFWNMIGPQ